jgi:hypothetical protein
VAGDSVAIKGAESIEPGKNIHPVFIRFYLTKWENGIILKGNLQELETFQFSETAVFPPPQGRLLPDFVRSTHAQTDTGKKFPVCRFRGGFNWTC